MMFPAYLAVLAATAPAQPLVQAGRHDTSLGVTATVVRPIEISIPSIRAEGAVVTVSNTVDVDVSAVGATVDQADPDTAIVTGDGARSMTITIIY